MVPILEQSAPDLAPADRLQHGHPVRTVTVNRDRSYESVRRIYSVSDACMCLTGRNPALLLLGWRTFLELSLYLSEREFEHAAEFGGIPLVCDPSRENYAQAVENKALIGCSKGPFVWEGK